MSGSSTKKRQSPEEARVARIDRERLLRMSEADIAATSPPELADLPEDFWEGASVVVPPPKVAISLRVDQDVLAWFKSQGPRYQTRMNAVLRSYMAAMARRDP